MQLQYEKKLIEKYPYLFQTNEFFKPSFSRDCYDEWFPLIDTTLHLISENKCYFQVSSVKNFQGELLIFLTPHPLEIKDDYCYGLITMASGLSQMIRSQYANKLKDGENTKPQLQSNEIYKKIFSYDSGSTPYYSKWIEMIHKFYSMDYISIQPSPNKFRIHNISIKEGFKISYEGSDEVTRGMISLLEEYSLRIIKDDSV